MELCHADIGDAASIAEIHVSAWRAAYAGIVPSEYLDSLSISKRETYWREAIANRSVPNLVVVKDRGQVVGWAAFGPCRDEEAPSGLGELWAIYATPSYWSKGVGRMLWLHARTMLAKHFSTVSLWVLAENERAIKFYLTAGFHPEQSSRKIIKYSGKPLNEIRYLAELNG